LRNVERVHVADQPDLLNILGWVHSLSADAIDDTHVFTLSQVYEGLLLRMGEKNNDGGQFFTPREVIRAMVRVIGPHIGETVYGPGCGTGGFLAQSYEHIKTALDGSAAGADSYNTLKEHAFYGREKDVQTYPIALANLALPGIDHPHL
jgi:type I restriction enzyme M protein